MIWALVDYVSWQQIESDLGRYRLLSDGTLEIVSLYRNDSGVYICVADNGLGQATQQIHLEVAGEMLGLNASREEMWGRYSDLPLGLL